MSVKKAGQQTSLHVSRDTADNYMPGRREFLRFRNLGTAELTDGSLGATVIKAKEGMHEPTGWHIHECDWQNIYIVKGWAHMEFLQGNAIEPVKVDAGDFYMLRGGTIHRELATSDDMVAIELTLPAEMRTVPVETPDVAKG